ncbi:MAG: ribosomal-processing cysteine protease Prp [Clostridiales bacterium]|jgi:uncharacterized protein YsxB (DUF464 family)|nr:ribosomal-processing cysteine protease Prp [Clostridiales bacterium]HOB64449.1 ribosomal-processing cysteine protease Prp [Clostridia bacterium]HOK81932.1 ribosomal-processing cysteine protease Prp [Clostridia bacterium]HOL61254.1 ribosomal-processing cysteine protease Prp [Clostridia bacterium]HPO53932.1 ribosomal-processing cysteine protease Prp [Clostridia bacterium]
MTKVKLFYSDGMLIGLEARGHSGYAEAGKDIVCAAISTLIQTGLLALTEVAGAEVEKKEKDGYLYYKVISNNAITLEKSDIILKSIVVGLADIAKGYPSHIRLEETKNVH